MVGREICGGMSSRLLEFASGIDASGKSFMTILRDRFTRRPDVAILRNPPSIQRQSSVNQSPGVKTAAALEFVRQTEGRRCLTCPTPAPATACVPHCGRFGGRSAITLTPCSIPHATGSGSAASGCRWRLEIRRTTSRIARWTARCRPSRPGPPRLRSDRTAAVRPGRVSP
jgi:hypothetical protein